VKSDNIKKNDFLGGTLRASWGIRN
ncbi:MAG: hypothetical protein ACI956_002578, partial [Nonlabens sp.]